MAVEKGLMKEVEHTVTGKDTAACFANPGVEVLATPVMVAWLEEAAVKAVEPYLEEGQATVGTTIRMKHLAATPVGMKVRAIARLKEVEGRRLHFEVEAYDEKEKVAEGEHERFIISLARFLEKATQKAKEQQD